MMNHSMQRISKKSMKNVNSIPEIEEDDDVNDLYIPERPSYFDLFDKLELDSEDEQAIGENNYIEIYAMPLERHNQPAAEIEEEKKEIPVQTSSKHIK